MSIWESDGEMEKVELDSDLGNIVISKEHFERERSDMKDWEGLEEAYPDEKLIDQLHFADIKSIEPILEPEYPSVQIETEEGEGKVYFKDRDIAEKFFKLLRYRYRCFKQSYE